MDERFLSAGELKQLLESGEPVTLLDVRGEKARRASGLQIPGSIRVPLSRWRIDESWPSDRLAVVYCSCPGDVSSVRAARRLLEAGLEDARALQGGFEAWIEAGGAVEPCADSQ
jgi:rhodanese-related sulfurtransferase